MTSNVWDYVNSITTNKKNLMRDSENDALAEKDYNPWIINLALSMHSDTILHANQINLNYHLDNRPQYEYLLNSVRKKFRKGWVKEAKIDNLELICEVYKCNKTKAKEYLTLLSKDQIKSLKESRNVGG
jgi:hypothetical protein